LQVQGREWRDHPLLGEAWKASTPPGAVVATLARASGEPVPEQGEEVWRWCWQAPDRLRVEFAVGIEIVTAWFNGATWWSWSPSQGARTNEGREGHGHGKGPGEVLLSPARVAHVLDFEQSGHLVFLGRRAYGLTARPFAAGDHDLERRLRGDFDLSALGRGAEDYEFVVDAERGFLLRSEARFGGRPFRVLEMTDLVVDADIPEEVFTPEAPDGDAFEFFEPIRWLSIEELPDAVPFKVFVPTVTAGPASSDQGAPVPPLVHVTLHNAQPRRAIPLSVTLSYMVPKRGGGLGNLWVSESADVGKAAALPTESWGRVDELAVATDDSMGYLRCKVLLEREGTHIHVESTAMTLPELVAVARSLVPLGYPTPS
jgi:hypothetical protein